MKYIYIASLLSAAAYAAPAAPLTGATSVNAAAPKAAAPAAGAATAPKAQGQAVGANGQVQESAAGITQANSPQAVAALTTLKSTAGSAPGVPTTQTPTDVDLATAVINWQADTSMVSNFLDVGKGITDETAFKQAAAVAYNAEVDELNHKAVIDAATSTQPQVQSANSTLATGGSFQQVVDLLLEMSVVGRSAVGDIDLILQNRCVNVLPNIDAYMASTGSNIQSVRPKVCDQTGIAGGVQGNGATLPGDAPGSPAAAIAAAKALAAGTGNGLVDNASFPIAGASAQTASTTAPKTGAPKAAAPAAGAAGAAKAPAAEAAAPATGAAKAPAANGAAKAPAANGAGAANGAAKAPANNGAAGAAKAPAANGANGANGAKAAAAQAAAAEVAAAGRKGGN